MSPMPCRSPVTSWTMRRRSNLPWRNCSASIRLSHLPACCWRKGWSAAGPAQDMRWIRRHPSRTCGTLVMRSFLKAMAAHRRAQRQVARRPTWPFPSLAGKKTPPDAASVGGGRAVPSTHRLPREIRRERSRPSAWRAERPYAPCHWRSAAWPRRTRCVRAI